MASDQLTLPVGLPISGYVTPDLSFQEGQGTLPQEEIDWHAQRDADRDADATAVADYEHEVATAVREDRLDTSKLRITSMDPMWCSVAGENVLLRVFGSGFTPTSKIVFAGNEEPISFISENEITTIVTAGIFFPNTTVPVAVKETSVGNEADGEGELWFTFWP